MDAVRIEMRRNEAAASLVITISPSPDPGWDLAARQI
jgi:hypothetical protein